MARRWTINRCSWLWRALKLKRRDLQRINPFSYFLILDMNGSASVYYLEIHFY